MALLVLIVLGASLGWLASIITRTERSRDILRQMGAATAGAVVAGLLANTGTFLGGLSLIALGVAIVAAIVALVVYHTVVRPKLAA